MRWISIIISHLAFLKDDTESICQYRNHDYGIVLFVPFFSSFVPYKIYFYPYRKKYQSPALDFYILCCFFADDYRVSAKL